MRGHLQDKHLTVSNFQVFFLSSLELINKRASKTKTEEQNSLIKAEDVELRVKSGVVDCFVRNKSKTSSDNIMNHPGTENASKSSGKIHGSEHILI